MKNLVLFLALLTAIPATNNLKAQAEKPENPPQLYTSDAALEYETGRNLLHGRGVDKDPAAALEHFRKAAELGHIEAPGAIGYFYSTGTVVNKDDVKAAGFFRQGAESGSAAAKFNLGKFHLDQRGGVDGVEEGLRLMEQAADLGLTQAHTSLAEIYFFGNDRIPVDYTKAFRHAEAAAQAGVSTSETMVGVMKEHGYGTEASPNEAEKWYRQAAQKGETKAQSNLGHLLDPASGDPKRRIEATAWLIIAASQSEPLATRSLVDIEQQMSKKDFAKARDLADELQKKIAGGH